MPMEEQRADQREGKGFWLLVVLWFFLSSRASVSYRLCVSVMQKALGLFRAKAFCFNKYGSYLLSRIVVQY
ncbi:hypothetical protein, partial [Flaviaesturariibacter amylovorans]|uniref:hypothetical protein n=1 Tax=Flaviaesturariibacter amylovorans TaxID=1084520 RepID=UPI0031E7F070